MAPVKLFCSDLDGTLIGNPEATKRFSRAWMAIPPSGRPMLCYASGRLSRQIIGFLPESNLPWPDYIIGGVGTQIYDCRRRKPVQDFNKLFHKSWDLGRIEEILGRIEGIRRQPPTQLHPYKSSWYLEQAPPEKIASLEKELASAGLKVNVVYSSGRDLDILPGNANKGAALEWLCARIGVGLDGVVVSGDSGNDSSMFLLQGVRGIVVENAQPDLIEAVVRLPTYNASRVVADGVLEGLVHFGVIPEAPGPETAVLEKGEMDPTLRMLFTTSSLGSLNHSEREYIAHGYRQALAALRKNVTPMGFTACSTADNDITGVDANYHRVWARDGSIVIADTIDLEDPEIRGAQKATLRTLFDRIAENGQIPANVALDDGSADYSGVGGICSVDSGLWAIIAFYLYVRKTADFELLAQYSGGLQRVMDWLSALDSNNDSLLEVPEAGDWTDLFGRSYHVLYDEVLWYRANVSLGRLLELRGLFDAASGYLRRSQLIRGRILASFWPSTKSADARPSTFADNQFSVGDASYLLAEITPFGFNWRCDVLGNIHAYLANILDAERARTAFRFMWGVGVNEPYPVANLYPAVQSGDPDWKSYYTVNLLNLPYHYHNGGTWPFIGGMWVRFIHRLGLYEVACRELLKLAEVNHLGKSGEWEFNEWVHSRTGRPMGKRYQAWSASSYIHACQELQVSHELLEAE
jgi:sucrose-6F-phosphate phosphohydrolase